MTIHRYLLCSAMLLMQLTSAAVADDFLPPPWRNLSAPYYTIQAWEFLTAANLPAQPDDPSITPIVGNGGGSPSINIQNMHWDAYDGSGGWVPNGPPGGIMQIYCPNWIDFMPMKWIWLQVTYVGNPTSMPTVITVAGQDNVAGPVTGFPMTPPQMQPIDPFNGIWGMYQHWAMVPNPDWEYITLSIPADTLITQVVIDTISFPEPASAGLLALSGLLMVTRRRR